MKKFILIAVVVVIVAMAAGGCGQYAKMQKSEDLQQVYEAAIGYFEAGKYQRAITLFEKVGLWSMNTSKADTVMYYTGVSYYKMGQFDISGMTFDEFRKLHSRSPFLEEAEYMYAKGFYFLSPEANRDQTETHNALRAIDEYLERYPNSVKREALEENVRELMQKLHDKEFINAKSYFRTGKYKAAVVALKNALAMYPDSNHREELMYLITKSAYELASRSVENLRRDRYLDMVEYYYNYISEFPEGQWARELGRLHENARKYLSQFSEVKES